MPHGMRAHNNNNNNDRGRTGGDKKKKKNASEFQNTGSLCWPRLGVVLAATQAV